MSWTENVQNNLLLGAFDNLKEEIFDLNDWMAGNPELGSQEFGASNRITTMLRQHGMSVEVPFCGLPTAFKASVNGGEKRRKAVLLAEYDALPDIGHGCGHCAGGAAAVMAILALRQIEHQLGDIQIDIVGTPDEEQGGGKVLLAKAGAFDEYQFAAMVHMNDINLSKVSFSAIDGMTFEFRGHPAHAAFAPEAGRNAFNAARLFFDGVDMMRQHVAEKARLHGYIVEGGSAANTIPDFARVDFCTRSPYRTELDDITAWVKDCARAAALATRTELTILPFGVDYDSFETGVEKNNLIVDCFRSLDMEIDGTTEIGGGSSDIANVDSVCPAFHPMIGIGEGLVAHTREFAEAMTMPKTHQAIETGAKILIQLCYLLFTQPERMGRIRDEHKTHK